MLTLHTFTEDIKSFGKWGIILLLLCILLIFTYQVFLNLKETFFPTPPPLPTVSFGKLSYPVLTQKIEKKLTYTIDTLSGLLPVFPSQMKIYKLTQSEPSLLASQRASEKVSQVGFTGQGTILSDKLYQWKSNTTPQKTLVYNIDSQNFLLLSSYINETTLLTQSSFLDENMLINQAQSFIGTLTAFPNDIDSQKTKTSFFSVTDGQLIPLENNKNVQIARIDFFQQDIETVPIIYDNPPFSSMYAILLPKQNPLIVEASYTHNNLTDDYATYPLKTADEAYISLQQGKGIILANPQPTTSITITNSYLAYFLGRENLLYTFPFIVFEGKNGFFAYVPAVKDEWITEVSEE